MQFETSGGEPNDFHFILFSQEGLVKFHGQSVIAGYFLQHLPQRLVHGTRDGLGACHDAPSRRFLINFLSNNLVRCHHFVVPKSRKE
jgi:hypothetical protein